MYSSPSRVNPNEKNSKLNQLINETINSFNKRFSELNNEIIKIKQDFNSQMIYFQNIINDENQKKYPYKKSPTIQDKKPKWDIGNPNIEKGDSKRHKSPPSCEVKNLKNLNSKLNSDSNLTIVKKNTNDIIKPEKNPKVLKGIMRKNRSLTVYNADSLRLVSLLNRFQDEKKKSVTFIPEQINYSISLLRKKQKLDSKYKAIITLSNSLILTDEEKIKLKFLDKKLYNKIDVPDSYTNKLIFGFKKDFDNSSSEDDLSSKDFNRDNSVSINNANDELNKTIFPSKTCQVGINLITKKKEELIYSDTTDLGKELCFLLYILLELEDKFDKNKSLRDLFQYLFDNFKVNSIKHLFIKVIYPKVYIEADVDKVLFATFNKLIAQNLSEIKLVSKTRKSPLSWIAMNILEFDKCFEMFYNQGKIKQIEK